MIHKTGRGSHRTVRSRATSPLVSSRPEGPKLASCQLATRGLVLQVDDVLLVGGQSLRGRCLLGHRATRGQDSSNGRWGLVHLGDLHDVTRAWRVNHLSVADVDADVVRG